MKKSAKLVTIGAILLASTAWAVSLEEKQWRTRQETLLQKDVDSTNTKCGTHITSTFDWSTIKLDDWKNDPGYYCTYAAHAISGVCGTPDGKQSVQKQIKKITCVGGDTLKVDLKDGNLTDVVTTKGYSQQPDIQNYLMKHL